MILSAIFAPTPPADATTTSPTPASAASSAPSGDSDATAAGEADPTQAKSVTDACAYDPVMAQEALDEGEPPTRRR